MIVVWDWPLRLFHWALAASVLVAWFTPNVNWINEQQARLTEIAAPPFQEGQRAGAVKTLLAAAGLTVQTDATGNVIGELRGINEKEIVVLSAHLDTVFPSGTDVRVRHEGSRMLAPGISDWVNRAPEITQMVERKTRAVVVR